jgi:hypothetical protein
MDALKRISQLQKISHWLKLWEIPLLSETGTLLACQTIRYRVKMVSLLLRLRDMHYVLIHNNKPTSGLKTWRKIISLPFLNSELETSSERLLELLEMESHA